MSTLNPDQFATKSIRSRSVPNVEDERLTARLEGLRDHLSRSREWAEQKGGFRDRVVETVHIERELEKRGIPHQRVTRRDWA